MSQIDDIRIKVHNNIYTDEERTIPVRIALPDAGVDDETTMLVISYGYGATYTANIFQKLMNRLPDQYNMVVLSGAYFGSNYMNSGKVEIDLSIGSEQYGNEVYVTKYMEENEHDFNDMGIMQGLDTVYMTLEGLAYIGRKSEEMRHIIVFGSSHGGYISHLANLMCPNLYSYILDISSYTFPYYIGRVRVVHVRRKWIDIEIGWEYFVNENSQYQVDDKLLDLKFLYSTSANKSRMILFQGTRDWMVDYKEKKELCNIIGDGAEFMLFTQEDVDGTFIKDADHGLGMNFEVLFDMILPLVYDAEVNRQKIAMDDVILGEGRLVLDYTSGHPIVKHVEMKK